MSIPPGLAAEEYRYRVALNATRSSTFENYHRAAVGGMLTWGRPFKATAPDKHGIFWSIVFEKFPLNPLTSYTAFLIIPHLGIDLSWDLGSWPGGGYGEIQLVDRTLVASACNGWVHAWSAFHFVVDGVVLHSIGTDTMSGALYRPSLNRMRMRPDCAVGLELSPFAVPACDQVPLYETTDQTATGSWAHYPGGALTYEPIDLDAVSAPPAPSGACGCTDTLLTMSAPLVTCEQVIMQSRARLEIIDPVTGVINCLCGDGINGVLYQTHEPQYNQQYNQTGAVTDLEQAAGSYVDLIPSNWGLLTSTLERAARCANAGPMPSYVPVVTTATFATTKAPFRRELSRDTGRKICGRALSGSACTNEVVPGVPQPPPAYCGPTDAEVCAYDGYVMRTLVDNCEQYDLHLAWQHSRPMWAAARGDSGVKLVGFNYREGFFRYANVVDAADVESAQVAVVTSGGCGIAYSQGSGANNVIKWVESKDMGDTWSTPEIVTPLGPPQIFGKQAVAACDRISGWIYVAFYKLNGPVGWDFYRRRRNGGSWEFVSHFDSNDIGRGALEFSHSRNRRLVFVYERGGNVYWRESVNGGSNWMAEELIAAGVRPAFAVGTQFGHHVLFVALDDGVNVKLYRRKIYSESWTFMSNIRLTLSTEFGLDWSEDGPNRLTFVYDQGQGLERLATTNFGLTWGDHPFADGGI